MVDSRSLLEIIIDVKDAAAGARQIREVGDATKTAGQAAETSGSKWQGMGSKLAQAAGGALFVKKGFSFMKGAADNATQLAKATGGLQRVTGMDAEASSGWVSMAKQRGIETNKLQQSFGAFSRQQTALANGSKSAGEAFKQLGIDQATLADGNTDFYGSLMMVADGFADMPAGAEKTALATKLFGRQGRDLLPILNQGSAGLEDQLGHMKSLGLTMDEQGIKKAQDLAKAQRELRGRLDGVKTTIGQALIPVIATLADKILPVVASVTEFISKSPVLTTAVIGIATALGVLLVVTKLMTIAQTLLNASFLANPITWVVLAIVALIAILVILYNKVDWFRAGVDAAIGAAVAAFNWLKTAIGDVISWVGSNWPLIVGILTGPIGFAIAMVIKNFDRVKQIVASVFNAVKGTVANAVNGIVGLFTSLPGKLVSALGSLGSGLGGVFAGAGKASVNALLRPINKAIGLINSKLIDNANRVPFVNIPHIPNIPQLATGGTIARAGLAIVGEAGLELLHLNQGAQVTPLRSPAPTPLEAFTGTGRPIHIHLEVDGREIASVVAGQAELQAAAR